MKKIKELLVKYKELLLYVVFGEILPQAILMYHSKLPAFSAIVGMLVGLFIIFA